MNNINKNTKKKEDTTQSSPGNEDKMFRYCVYASIIIIVLIIVVVTIHNWLGYWILCIKGNYDCCDSFCTWSIENLPLWMVGKGIARHGNRFILRERGPTGLKYVLWAFQNENIPVEKRALMTHALLNPWDKTWERKGIKALTDGLDDKKFEIRRASLEMLVCRGERNKLPPEAYEEVMDLLEDNNKKIRERAALLLARGYYFPEELKAKVIDIFIKKLGKGSIKFNNEVFWGINKYCDNRDYIVFEKLIEKFKTGSTKEKMWVARLLEQPKFCFKESLPMLKKFMEETEDESIKLNLEEIIQNIEKEIGKRSEQ